MTGYELLGNLPTGNTLQFTKKQHLIHQIDLDKFKIVGSIANDVFIKGTPKQKKG